MNFNNMITSANPPVVPVRPKVALVLGSGGLNALAAIPLIEFLEMNGIRLDLLVGCSGGAMTTGMLACGFKPRDMAEVFSKCVNPSMFPKDWWNIAIMVGLRTKGFSKSISMFKSGPILKMMRSVVGEIRLEDLQLPLVLQATDFDTGEGVELDSGDLVNAAYASCAAYPFFHPIEIDGRWLFDGAFSAPMPILPAARRGVDIILAVDFSEKLHTNPKTFLQAMVHLNKVLAKSLAQSQMLASIDLHRHEILNVKVRFPTYIKLWETEAYERIQAAGRQAVEEYGPQILTAVRDFIPGPVRPAGSASGQHGLMPEQPR